MKQYPTAKLYENMGMKERALCAMAAATRKDEAELMRIVQSVPRRQYLCADTGYSNWCEKAPLVAFIWAASYWRACAAVAGAATAGGVVDEIAKDEAVALIDKNAARVRALDLVLADVCEAARIPESLVRAFTGVPADGFCAKAEPDEAYRAQVRSELLACLPPA